MSTLRPLHATITLLLALLLAGQYPARLQAPTRHDTPPTLRFSTYLGGTNIDISTAIAVDANGYVYVAGQTLSDDFPTQTPAMDYQGGMLVGADVFIAKFNPGGDALVYATYLGGRLGEEMATTMVVDAQGRVYVAGTATAPDFPTRNPLQSYQGGTRYLSDAFVARLSADGTVVEFATFLGGTGDETATALALGPDGSLYVTGTTTSTDFPTTGGAFQPDRAGDPDQAQMDAFLVKLTPDGEAFDIAYATYLGGAWAEIPNAVSVDADGNAWLAGMTTSNDFPLQDALQTEYAGPFRDLEGDVFVARLRDDGSALDFATYLGGNQDDQATGLTLSDDGAVYLTGSTMSSDFPTTPGAYQTERQGLKERFVARLVPMAGSWMLDEATRLSAPGGSVMSRAGLTVDRAGRVWIAGATVSAQFPTVDAEQSMYRGGESDAFLARLDASGRALGYATYLGGSEADVVTAVAQGDDAVCLTGSTSSPDFPMQAALYPSFDGPITAGRNLTSVFVTCFETVNEAAVLARMTVAPDSVGLIAGETVQLMAEGFDQFDQPLAVDAVWTATGGTIDSTGRYTAGDDAGIFEATATNPETGLTGTALINIFSGVASEDAADVPDAFALHGNYPNPFNPQTTIRFDVKAAARVVLTIYDVLGRKQATLLEKNYAPGRHEVHFDGRGWPSGTYFYVIEMSASESQRQTFRAAQKMVLLR